EKRKNGPKAVLPFKRIANLAAALGQAATPATSILLGLSGLPVQILPQAHIVLRGQSAAAAVPLLWSLGKLPVAMLLFDIGDKGLCPLNTESRMALDYRALHAAGEGQVLGNHPVMLSFGDIRVCCNRSVNRHVAVDAPHSRQIHRKESGIVGIVPVL